MTNQKGTEFLGTVTGMAVDLLKERKSGEISLGKLKSLFDEYRERGTSSLPSFIKRCTVDSRAFISKEAAMEECINDVLYANNALYVSWVSTALAMNQMVGNTRVRDMLSIVATEKLHPSPYTLTVEAAIDSIPLNKDTHKPASIYATEDKHNRDDTTSGVVRGPAGSEIINTPTEYNLLAGLIVEVSFAISERQTVTLPVLVRINPSLISDEVATQFFKANYKPDFWMRWFKVKTGEISFWKDFMFELDLRKERDKVLRQDKSGALHDMLLQQKSAFASYIGKLFGWRSERQNIASAIHVYTKRQFDQWCHQLNINFDRADDRDKFFSRTFSVIVDVIDSDYNRVYCYVAGMNTKAEYSFSQLQNNRNKQQYDLASIMRAFSQQSTPRF